MTAKRKSIKYLVNTKSQEVLQLERIYLNERQVHTMRFTMKAAKNKQTPNWGVLDKQEI